LDSSILVIALLVVNLTTFSYSESTTIGILMVLILLPLCVVLLLLVAKELLFPKMMSRNKYRINVHSNNDEHMFDR